jgi:hypothetical protein
MFVREADHRIKNSLQAVISLLDRQANRTKVEAARDTLPVATARVSSAVAVSGGRLRNAAKLCTNRTQSRCVASRMPRMAMSSSMRRRSGLMGCELAWMVTWSSP